MAATFDNFYQFGFVARDLERATEALAKRYGVSRFRRKRSSAWLETAHAWTGSTMIEVMLLRDGAPALYDGFLPDDPAAIRLHHHGFRVPDDAAWSDLERRIDDAGLAAPMKGTIMNGNVKFMYVDTRADLGIYCEFIMLTGDAAGFYDDVPRN